MRPRERQSHIADLVREQGRVSVETLSQRFRASVETIRRDLAVLAAEGVIAKVHGAATVPRAGEDTFHQRMGQHTAAKRHIAGRARQLVSAGDTLFIDTGTTTLLLAEELVGIEDLTVITNSVEIARVLGSGSQPATVYLVGGAYNADNRQTHGMMAMSQLGLFRGTRAMLAIGTVDAVAGAMDYNVEEAQVARAMIEHSQSAVILADSSKFNRVAPFAVGPLGRFDALVCECEPAATLRRALDQNNVEVVY